MLHLLLGMAPAYVLGLLVYMRCGRQASTNLLLLTPLWMAAGAAWAVAPDIPRLFRQARIYNILHQDTVTNVFLFHFNIDQIESYSSWHAMLVLFMLTSLLLAAYQELKRENNRQP